MLFRFPRQKTSTHLLFVGVCRYGFRGFNIQTYLLRSSRGVGVISFWTHSLGPRDPITERQRMSQGCPIIETKRKVFRFHETILRR